MLFIACFEATGTTFVDYVGNYLGDNVQYSYSVSKTSISLLRIQETERDMGLVRKIVSEEGRNQNYHRVLQVLITSSESNEFFLSGMSFILFSNCASMVVSNIYAIVTHLVSVQSNDLVSLAL